jgi:hypothetical protein
MVGKASLQRHSDIDFEPITPVLESRDRTMADRRIFIMKPA